MMQPVDMLIEQHHKDMMREASQRRLARQASQSGYQSTPAHFKALAALGHAMTVAGEQLEQRYGKAINTSSRVAFEQ